MEAGLNDIYINVNVPFRDSWVLLPNMSSEAFIGAVSLASIVSTFPVDKHVAFFIFITSGHLNINLRLVCHHHLLFPLLSSPEEVVVADVFT